MSITIFESKADAELFFQKEDLEKRVKQGELNHDFAKLLQDVQVAVGASDEKNIYFTSQADIGPHRFAVKCKNGSWFKPDAILAQVNKYNHNRVLVKANTESMFELLKPVLEHYKNQLDIKIIKNYL